MHRFLWKTNVKVNNTLFLSFTSYFFPVEASHVLEWIMQKYIYIIYVFIWSNKVRWFWQTGSIIQQCNYQGLVAFNTSVKCDENMLGIIRSYFGCFLVKVKHLYFVSNLFFLFLSQQQESWPSFFFLFLLSSHPPPLRADGHLSSSSFGSLILVTHQLDYRDELKQSLD